MIYLQEEGIYIKNPEEFDDFNPKLKNYLRENMKRGLCIFKVPEHIEESLDKKAYKTGFLNEFLARVYPEHTKRINAEIISDKFHVFCGYRQLNNLISSYEQRKVDYIKQ